MVPKGFTVLSFDLVSDGAFVVQADTCSKIPLPGSEKEEEGEEEGEEGLTGAEEEGGLNKIML